MTDKQTYMATVRQGIYLVVLTLFVVLLWKVGDIYKSSAIREFGIFETGQSVILLLASLSFGIQAIKNTSYRALLLLLSSLALAALVREQDAFMDHAVPYLGWTWCWIFPIAAMVYFICKLRKDSSFFTAFLRSNTFHMFVTAAVIIIPVAQCLGHRSFLVDMLEDPTMDSHLVRRLVEEPIELLGYLQMLIASIEFAIELRKK